ncbi:MAG: hypothetical protein JXB49_26770 [Bacteroidales bacterium]|nr:hypothetical protein [Bacteroidales bacterium]
MDHFTNKVKRFFSSDSNGGKPKYLAFIVFLGLSAILWFFAALNEEYKGEISYPVEYINFPKDKILVNDLPNKLRLNVEANGYTLLGYKLGPKLQSIIYDIEKYSMRKVADGSESEFYLLTSPAINMVEEQLGKDFRVLDMQPDTLFFRFTDIVVKRVPIVPDILVTCVKPFRIHGHISVNPDSILITGPGYILDTLEFITSKHYELKEMEKSLTKSVQLLQIKRVTYTQKRVDVNIPIEEYTENSFEIPITKMNVPDSINLILFPDKVKVTYMVALSDYEKIDPSQFIVRVDYSNVDVSGSNRVRVSMFEYPELVENAIFTPTSVEYLKEIK